jgi:hypothetical protein
LRFSRAQEKSVTARGLDGRGGEALRRCKTTASDAIRMHEPNLSIAALNNHHNALARPTCSITYILHQSLYQSRPADKRIIPARGSRQSGSLRFPRVLGVLCLSLWKTCCTQRNLKKSEGTFIS